MITIYYYALNSDLSTAISGKAASGHTHDDRYYTESEIDTKLNGKAPTSHASTATTYGIGNASNYGHVKLSDTYNSNVGAAANAIGASQTALYNAWNQIKGTSEYYEIAINIDSTNIAQIGDNGRSAILERNNFFGFIHFHYNFKTKIAFSSFTSYKLGSVITQARPITGRDCLANIISDSSPTLIAAYVTINDYGEMWVNMRSGSIPKDTWVDMMVIVEY